MNKPILGIGWKRHVHETKKKKKKTPSSWVWKEARETI